MQQASKWKKEKKKIHFNINYLVEIFSNNCIPKVRKLNQTINFIITKKTKRMTYWQIKNRLISNSKDLNLCKFFKVKSIHSYNLCTSQALWI